jgi:murein DD-endopeptidase MepM/ murein hydrolase activator NlpD
VKQHAVIAVVMVLLSAARAFAGGDSYPEIRILTRDDPLYLQQQQALEDFRRLCQVRGPADFPPVDIFAYARRDADDLFTLNARTGLRYDTLATLNDAASRPSFDARRRVLIPSQEGLFVNNPPHSELESMMLSTRLADGKTPLPLVIVRDGKTVSAWFFRGESFTAMERSYFLGILFRLPIDTVRITSMYGWRPDPFTGKEEFHEGLDFGAADGTEVHAARDGVVEEAGRSDVLGTYVVLTHPGGYQTVYGHLSTVRVIINQKVSTGAILGEVGHTGRATGPHLHFEVRTKTGTTDPWRLLAMKRK